MARTTAIIRVVALVAAASLVSAACGDDDTSTAPTTTSAATTTAVTTTAVGTTSVATTRPPTTSPPTTGITSTTVAPSCSAAGLSPTVEPQAGLPPVVATMRQEIARAAATCDWAALAALADRNGRGVNVSFGGATDPVAFWQRAEKEDTGVKPMRALRTLLGVNHAVQPLAGDAVQYVWPAAHATAQPSTAQLQEVAATGLYPLATLQEWSRSTGYLGYRILITANGDWTAFVAGD